jgi:hypothetical protein
MAIYTTFFLGRPEELLGGFPAWQLPLEKAVRREVRNPFTGEVSVIESREPDWPDHPSDETDLEARVVKIKGNYEDYLESRLPPFVRTCAHWAAKGLTEVEVIPLVKAAGAAAALEPALYSPPSSGAMLQKLPPEFLAKLGSADQKALAKKWATAMSAPEHTHSVTGVKLSDGWTMNEAHELLQPLVALAKKAALGQHMYLLTEA